MGGFKNEVKEGTKKNFFLYSTADAQVIMNTRKHNEVFSSVLEILNLHSDIFKIYIQTRLEFM